LKSILLDSYSSTPFGLQNKPFAFEKKKFETKWLPLRRAFPTCELFASIDDDLGVKNSSLVARGLYPDRVKRQSYDKTPSLLFLIPKKIISFIKILFGIILGFVFLIFNLKFKFAKDFISSHLFITNSNRNPLPWMNYFAISFIEKNIDDIDFIFEFGSGSSTLYWQSKGKNVISIEHNKSFFDKLLPYLSPKTRYLLHEPSIISNSLNTAHSSKYVGYDFTKYSNSIENFPNESFDMILIDGRSRAVCLEKSINKIKKGGYIVFDNSDRDEYKSSINRLLHEWERFDFTGPVPGMINFETTSIFKSPIN